MSAELDFGINLDTKKCYEKKIEPYKPGNKLQPFQILNWVAVVLHATSAIVMMVVYEEQFSLPTTESYLNWTRTSPCVESDGRRLLNTSNNGKFCIEPVTEGVCEDCGIDLGWLIISFHLLSFLFQAVAGFTDFFNITKVFFGKNWNGYVYLKNEDFEVEEVNNEVWGKNLDKGCFGYQYKVMVENGRNPLRFIEYSISAAIMLISIALVNGVTDVNLLAAVGVLTAGCQICGLVVEYLNKVELKWILHFNGWLLFFCAYGIIYHAFSKAVDANDSVKPPDFVYVIVIVLFLLYACFGIVQFTELLCLTRLCSGCFCNFCKEASGNVWCPRCRETITKQEVICEDNNLKRLTVKKSRCNPLYKEMVFVTLSLGAKVTLGWLIFSNVLMNQRS